MIDPMTILSLATMHTKKELVDLASISSLFKCFFFSLDIVVVKIRTCQYNIVWRQLTQISPVVAFILSTRPSQVHILTLREKFKMSLLSVAPSV